MSEILDFKEQINHAFQQFNRIAEEILRNRRIKCKRKEYFKDFKMIEYVDSVRWF